MKSMGQVLDEHRGLAPGFDFVRVFLAFSVVGYHCVSVIHGNFDEFWKTPGWFLNYSILPMFFGLSGFLIAGSAMRLKLRDFLINRGLRIVPALAVEIIFAACILGPIFTVLPLGDYFTSLGFWHYFSNIIGWINFYLPGVFKDHPLTAVNNSLWTIPWELLCYAMMSGLIVTGLIRRNPWLIVGAAVALLGGAALVQGVLLADGPRPGAVWTLVHALFVHRGNLLLVTFLLGIALYLFRHKIPHSRVLFGVCVAANLAAALFLPTAWQFSPLSSFVLAPMLVYITMYVGMTPIPKLPLFSRGDYSYGIYLYGMPVQQAVMHIFRFDNELWLFLVSAPAITIVAMVSWHWIEKPILRLRKSFSFVARQRLAEAEMKNLAVAPVAPPLEVDNSAPGPVGKPSEA